MANSYTFLSDIQLWQLLRQGNEKAVECLMDRHYSQLYYYGLRLCRNEALTEDHLQELFVELWVKRETLGDVQRVKPYLLKSLRRKLWRRTAIGKVTNPLANPEEYAFAFVLSPEELTIEAQHAESLQQELAAALDQLPARQKEAVYLRFYENLSYDEIAQVMTVSVPYLYELIYKATRNLRKHLTVAIKAFMVLVGCLAG